LGKLAYAVPDERLGSSARAREVEHLEDRGAQLQECRTAALTRPRQLDGKPVTPADLTATILYHLGIDHHQRYEDEFQRLQNRLSEGSPVRDLG
jgi:hypothetical protein